MSYNPVRSKDFGAHGFPILVSYLEVVHSILITGNFVSSLESDRTVCLLFCPVTISEDRQGFTRMSRRIDR